MQQCALKVWSYYGSCHSYIEPMPITHDVQTGIFSTRFGIFHSIARVDDNILVSFLKLVPKNLLFNIRQEIASIQQNRGFKNKYENKILDKHILVNKANSMYIICLSTGKSNLLMPNSRGVFQMGHNSLRYQHCQSSKALLWLLLQLH